MGSLKKLRRAFKYFSREVETICVGISIGTSIFLIPKNLISKKFRSSFTSKTKPGNPLNL